MRRAILISLMGAVIVALGGCGASGTPAAGGGRAQASTGPAAASGGAAPGNTPATPGGPNERPPTCYPAILTENSGNGPTYRVQICDALRKPRPGQEWQLIVDGGPLRGHAVILGQQIPRHPSHSG
jgi:hypothetical protein